MKKLICKIAAFVLILNIFSTNAAAANINNFVLRVNGGSCNFSDVKSNQWYYNDVINCYTKGLMKGKGANVFDPSGKLSVAEAVTLACRVNNIYNGGTGEIPNTGSKWYDGSVNYAVKNGIIEKDDFKDYEKTATRAELAYIFSNCLPKNELTPINNVTSLPDVNSNTNFKDCIMELYNAGVLTGTDSKGTYKPDTSIQRSEVCAIINRVASPTERKKVSLPTEMPKETTTPVSNVTPVKPEQPKQDNNTPVATDEVTQILNLVNAERKKAGLSALSIDSKVAAAAQVRAKESEKSFSHTRPDGTSCFTALKDAGVTYRLAGENIAYGQRTPQEVMDGWMNSPGHRANILKEGFTKIGIGVYKSANGTIYWSQMFIG